MVIICFVIFINKKNDKFLIIFYEIFDVTHIVGLIRTGYGWVERWLCISFLLN